MPGPDGSSEELDVESLLTTDAGSDQDTQQLQEGSNQQSTPEGQAKLYGGKYKTLQDYDKAHKSQQSAYTQAQQKLKTLDGILKNPELLAAAKANPQLRAALAQAGYSQVEEEAQQEEQRQGAWDGNENTVEFLRMEQDLRWQIRDEKASLEFQLKRPLSPPEWEAAQRENHLALCLFRVFHQPSDGYRTIGGCPSVGGGSTVCWSPQERLLISLADLNSRADFKKGRLQDGGCTVPKGTAGWKRNLHYYRMLFAFLLKPDYRTL